VHDRDRSAHRRIGKEDLSHFLGHANAAMRVRHTGQVAGVHADRASHTHEVRHGRAFEVRSGGATIPIHPDIPDDNIPSIVHEIAVEVGDMVGILLNDAETACRRIIPLPTAGNRRHAHELPSLVKIGFLTPEIDTNRWGTTHAITVPVAGLLNLASLGLLRYHPAIRTQILCRVAIGLQALFGEVAARLNRLGRTTSQTHYRQQTGKKHFHRRNP